jgi:hypothetical protein
MFAITGIGSCVPVLGPLQLGPSGQCQVITASLYMTICSRNGLELYFPAVQAKYCNCMYARMFLSGQRVTWAAI